MGRINSKQKGARGERDFIAAVCDLFGRERTVRDRRNNQWTQYGGANNPDVEIPELNDLHLEVKNTATFQFPTWTKKLLEDCPVKKVPVIAYKEARKGFWVLHRLEDIEKFAVCWCEALGYRVERGDKDNG